MRINGYLCGLLYMCKYLKILLICCVAAAMALPASAQKKRVGRAHRASFYDLFIADERWARNPFEVYFGLPVTQYMGDIGGTQSLNNWLGFRDISFRTLRPGFSAGMNYKYSNRFTFSGLSSLAMWSQTDKRSRNERRGHAFSTYGIEFSASCQYYFLPIKNIGYFTSSGRTGRGNKTIPWGLYLYAGAGANLFIVNPNESLKNDHRYKRNRHVAFVMPLGIGGRFELSQQWALEANFGRRFMFSDYFDGFTTQYSTHADVYYILNFTAHYRIVSSATFRQGGKVKKIKRRR